MFWNNHHYKLHKSLSRSLRELRKLGYGIDHLYIIIFVLLVVLITMNQALKEIGITIPFVASASLHAICPFGGVVSIYEFFNTGLFVQKTHESSFIQHSVDIP
ncbi:hypothetical protein [Desulfosporosinus nitroreducens]|uniref:hypothetical protein n=1 Tax=Desulfosporosinus nitroreducens TaxID=2018668 RepID=UPI00207C6163|nr:hypothetical protein [Desulfosporosinus nitroreducens]MCO1603719.1 hypothetical protein [Desulfosporosinus nitroreducens]